MFKRLVIGMAIIAILSFFGVAYVAVVDAMTLYAARSDAVMAVKEKTKSVKKKKKRGRHHESV